MQPPCNLVQIAYLCKAMQSSAGLHEDFERGALNPGRTCTEPELWTAPVLFQNLVGRAKHNCALSLRAMLAMQNRIVFFAPAMHSMQSMSYALCGGEVKRCHGNATNICVKQFSPWHGVANILQHNQVFTVLVFHRLRIPSKQIVMPFSENNLHPSSKYSATQRIFLVTADLAYFQDNNIYVANPWQLTFIYAATNDLTNLAYQQAPRFVFLTSNFQVANIQRNKKGKEKLDIGGRDCW